MKNSKEIKKNLKKAHKEFKQEKRYGNPMLRVLVDKTKKELPYVEITYERYKSDQKEIRYNFIVSIVFLIIGMVEVWFTSYAYAFSLILAIIYLFNGRTAQNHSEMLSDRILDAYDLLTQQKTNLDLQKQIDDIVESKTDKKEK